jgi:hypothetical protein
MALNNPSLPPNLEYIVPVVVSAFAAIVLNDDLENLFQGILL